MKKALKIISDIKKDSYVEESLASLKTNGARLTKTRKAVLDCLSKTSRPLTPAQIMSQINNSKITQTKIDLVSVYRILKYLSDLSLVHQVGADGSYFPCAHSNCKDQTHIIINCSSCNSVQEIHLPKETSSKIFEYIKKNANFSSDPHSLEIKGVCRSCSS